MTLSHPPSLKSTRPSPPAPDGTHSAAARRPMATDALHQTSIDRVDRVAEARAIENAEQLRREAFGGTWCEVEARPAREHFTDY